MCPAGLFAGCLNEATIGHRWSHIADILRTHVCRPGTRVCQHPPSILGLLISTEGHQEPQRRRSHGSIPDYSPFSHHLVQSSTKTNRVFGGCFGLPRRVEVQPGRPRIARIYAGSGHSTAAVRAFLEKFHWSCIFTSSLYCYCVFFFSLNTNWIILLVRKRNKLVF